METKYLEKLLKYREEPDWLDFKRKLKLWSAEEKLNIQARDELLKDILGLANGNTGIIRKTKYIIIGVDDKSPTAGSLRKLFTVNCKVPTQSDINKWLKNACDPAVMGIECDFAEIDDQQLYIITIPPTYDIHETTRELNAKSHHSPHTIFIRKGEHIAHASIREGIAIQQLKHLYRQETLNPPTILFGILLGAFIAVMLGNTGLNTSKPLILSQPWGLPVIQLTFAALGALFGGCASWFYREFKTTQYEWRYWTLRQRIVNGLIALLLILPIMALFWFK